MGRPTSWCVTYLREIFMSRDQTMSNDILRGRWICETCLTYWPQLSRGMRFRSDGELTEPEVRQFFYEIKNVSVHFSRYLADVAQARVSSDSRASEDKVVCRRVWRVIRMTSLFKTTRRNFVLKLKSFGNFWQECNRPKGVSTIFSVFCLKDGICLSPKGLNLETKSQTSSSGRYSL